MARRGDDTVFWLAAIGIGGFVLYRYLKPGASSITTIPVQQRVASGGAVTQKVTTTYASRDYIAWLQDSLNTLQGSNLVVDGILGPLTKTAIQRFQSTWQITADGVPGPETDYYIKSALGLPGYIEAPYGG